MREYEIEERINEALLVIHAPSPQEEEEMRKAYEENIRRQES